MKRLPVLLALLALPAAAQVQVQIQLPTVVFPAPPPLVVVEPGVQVVPDLDDEVFFVDDCYWHRRDGRWFKTKNHKGGWVVVDAPGVPPVLVRQTPGKWRRFKRATAVVPAPPPPGAAVVVPPPPPRRDDDDDDRGKGKHKHKHKKDKKGRGHDDDDD